MSTLSKECFAYPAKNKYPIHTKEAALTSYNEFQSDLGDYSEDNIKLIADNFIKAASVHNITYTLLNDIKSEDLTPFTCSDGTVIKIAKVNTALDIDAAVDFLKDLSKEIPLKELRKIACAIFKDADTLLPSDDSIHLICKFAGIGFGLPLEMALEFCKRGALINMPSDTSSMFYSVYRDLNNATSSLTMFKISTQLCDIFDLMDRMFKLSNYYGTKLKAPQDVCFSQNMDDLILEALDYLPVTSTGTIMSKSALLLNRDKVLKFFRNYYDLNLNTNLALFTKVASLSPVGIKTLIKELE